MKKLIKIPMSILAIVILMMAFLQMAPAASVNWNAPTEREDGTLLPQSEIGGFKLYYSDDTTTPGSYTNVIEIIEPLDRSIEIPDSDVDREAAVTAVDTDGRESAYSIPVLIKKFTPPVIAPPKPPTGVTAPDSTDRAVPIQ